jgi:hypothetical protein
MILMIMITLESVTIYLLRRYEEAMFLIDYAITVAPTSALSELYATKAECEVWGFISAAMQSKY